MSLLGNIRKELDKQFNKKIEATKMEFGSAYSISEVPQAIEKKGKDWVFYGEDNLYPQKLKELLTGSAIHNAIVKTKAMMTAGDGLLLNGAKTVEESDQIYNSLDARLKAEWDSFVNNTFGKESLQGVISHLSFDLHTYGAFSYEVVWNNQFDQISNIRSQKVASLRAGKENNGWIDSYWHSRDWEKSGQSEYKPRPIKTFDPSNIDSVNQIVYEKIGELEYYGEPSYSGALTWIQTDIQMGVFHLSNIENGMNPSMIMKFYQLPASEGDKQMILDEIRRRYTGSNKTGKHMVFFSTDKESAPDISAAEVSNLDKQMIVLAQLCDQKILTGHQLTSPLLVGIATAGQLGTNTQLEQAYQIFDNTIISHSRKMIERSLNKVLKINAPELSFTINPFNPFK